VEQLLAGGEVLLGRDADLDAHVRAEETTRLVEQRERHGVAEVLVDHDLVQQQDAYVHNVPCRYVRSCLQHPHSSHGHRESVYTGTPLRFYPHSKLQQISTYT
jgi:hypothetical protein